MPSFCHAEHHADLVPLLQDAMGSVGYPLPHLEFCLEGIPEMSYDPLASPPRGEVLIRGPVLFNGYYLSLDKTAEVVDTDGFFHTGDVGELDAHGRLRIIDRKKSLFKLSQGVHPPSRMCCWLALIALRPSRMRRCVSQSVSQP